MNFLKYGKLWFSKVLDLNRTELIIYCYVSSDNLNTSLTLKEWSELIGVTSRTISSAIHHLIELELIINISNRPNKLILVEKIYKNGKRPFLSKNDSKLLNDLIDKF